MSIRSVLIFTLALVFLVQTRETEACSCAFRTLPQIYYEKSNIAFIRAKVIRIKTTKDELGTRFYVLKVLQNYKGCPFKRITVQAITSSAACGIVLKKGAKYFIPIRKGKRPSINLCDGIRLVSKTPPEELKFLSTRNVCCGDSCSCAGDNLVFCFRPPCTPLPARPKKCKKAKCVNNFCGGCFAEWFDKDGMLCKSDAAPLEGLK